MGLVKLKTHKHVKETTNSKNKLPSKPRRSVNSEKEEKMAKKPKRGLSVRATVSSTKITTVMNGSGKKVNGKQKGEENTLGKRPQRVNVTKTTWLLPTRDHLPQHCFICNGPMDCTKKRKETTVKADDEDDSDELRKKARGLNREKDYIKCAFNKCPVKMHVSCAKKYNCSEYSPEISMLTFREDGPMCPLHQCWHCNEERKKNSSRFGPLVSCDQCYRSFHDLCIPAGVMLKMNKKGEEVLTCHYHTKEPEKKMEERMRSLYCSECEKLLPAMVEEEDGKTGEMIKKPNEARTACRGCPNVFHTTGGCHFDEVLAGCKFPFPGETKEYCNACLIGMVIVPGQRVLGWFKGRFENHGPGLYPATAINVHQVPKNCQKRLYNLGKVGYIPIRWEWGEKKGHFYDVLPQSFVTRMTFACKKNVTHAAFSEDMKRSQKLFIAPCKPLDTDAMRASIEELESCRYTKGTPRAQVSDPEEDKSCDCRVVNGVKCGEGCILRSLESECPPSCEEGLMDGGKKVKCLNRELGRGEKGGGKMMELKKTEKKGFGVFALKHFQKGEFLCEYTGEIIDMKEHDRRVERQQKMSSDDEHTFLMGLTGKMFVDARFAGNIARYMNHSCEPNAKAETIDICMGKHWEPRLKITAIRPIAPEEEVTIDYKLASSDGLVRDKCYCGAANCCGYIGAKKEEEALLNERFENANDDEDEEDSDDEEEKKEKPVDVKVMEMPKTMKRAASVAARKKYEDGRGKKGEMKEEEGEKEKKGSGMKKMKMEMKEEKEKKKEEVEEKVELVEDKKSGIGKKREMEEEKSVRGLKKKKIEVDDEIDETITDGDKKKTEKKEEKTIMEVQKDNQKVDAIEEKGEMKEEVEEKKNEKDEKKIEVGEKKERPPRRAASVIRQYTK